MDEPFSALDMETRTLMQDGLLQLWSANVDSVVLVTHDLEEAIALADRVVVLSARPATLKKVYEINVPVRAHVGGSLRPALHRDVTQSLARPARRSTDRMTQIQF